MGKITKIFEKVSINFAEILGTILGILYYPIYACAWVLHKVFRFMLALCYFLMFRWRMGADIIKYLFKNR